MTLQCMQRLMTQTPKFHSLSFRALSISMRDNISPPKITTDSKLIPNYGGQIPFKVSGSTGPFLVGNTLPIESKSAPKVLICNNAGYSSATIGYNPRWVSEVTNNAFLENQAMHISRAYHYAPLEELAEKLSDLSEHVIYSPENGPIQFCPCLGGSDAVEAALKLALKRGFEHGIPDGEQEVIFLKDPFHGRTRSVIGTGKDKEMFEGFAAQNKNFKECPINDIEQLNQLVNPKTVAIIVEPVQGEPGVHEISTDFAQLLRKKCNQEQTLLIADEVQTGFYRTGVHCFASEKIGLNPDIIVIAKALGGMVPLAGVLARADIAQTLSPGTHGSTYAGNALSCRIALENLKQYEAIQLGKNMQMIGDAIKNMLNRHKETVHEIRDVRGPGAMIALEMKTKGDADRLVKKLFNAGMDLQLEITDAMIESPHNFFNLKPLLGMKIQGIGVKTTQGGKTLRITPAFMSDAQLEATITMLEYALLNFNK